MKLGLTRTTTRNENEKIFLRETCETRFRRKWEVMFGSWFLRYCILRCVTIFVLLFVVLSLLDYKWCFSCCSFRGENEKSLAVLSMIETLLAESHEWNNGTLNLSNLRETRFPEDWSTRIMHAYGDWTLDSRLCKFSFGLEATLHAREPNNYNHNINIEYTIINIKNVSKFFWLKFFFKCRENLKYISSGKKFDRFKLNQR